MSPREVVQALLRRWPIWLTVLIVTSVAGWFVAHPTPTFTATEIVAVQPPATPQMPNKLTDIRPSLAITSAVIARRLKSPSGEQQLRKLGVVGEYDLLPRNSGTTQNPAYVIPSIQIMVTTHDADAAMHSVDLVLRTFASELVALQDEWAVAKGQRLSIAVLAPAAVQPLVRSRTRALAAAGLIGLAAAVIASLWGDRFARRHGWDGRLPGLPGWRVALRGRRSPSPIGPDGAGQPRPATTD